MDLKHALSILSKSSPYAVSTERKPSHDTLARYKDYIYVETEIEADFKRALTTLRPGDIIFLCGSSGDGKSEILTRYNQQWKSNYDFHLDATHSFKPNQTAIEALDELFRKTKESKRPLIVGINIGMLGNYAEEGNSDLHNDIKNSIKNFLDRRNDLTPSNHIYLDFEQYPKFTLSDEGNTSEFGEKLLLKLTEKTLDNPFFAVFDSQVKSKGHSKLTANFALLSLKSVQKNIISLLIRSRLIKDQFLTARALLDFIYQILLMDGYIFDNLFSGEDNELLENIKSFDPSSIHTRKIDEFILHFSLGIDDKDFIFVKDNLNDFGVFDISKAESFLRLIYLLKDEEQFQNNYIESFKTDFDNSLVNKYSSAWVLHRDFDATGLHKKEINKIYKEIIISAIHRYCNRNTPFLEKDVYFIVEYNGFNIAAELDVKANFSEISSNKVTKIGAFNAFIDVENKSLDSIPVTINLLELMIKINQGYRPNKHDKNAVLLLDEIIEQIVKVANEKDTLFIFKGSNRYKLSNQDNEYYEISGV